ncbi:MAG: hypothetical protein AB7O44_27445 [Hyphomicrobiaceae bacterium]
MANGGTIADLAANDRGKWAVLTAVVVIMAGGISFLITGEGRDYTDARIDNAITLSRALSDDRHQTLLARLDRIDREQSMLEAQLQTVEAAIGSRVDRDTMADRAAEVNRRLDAIERRHEAMERAVYGGRSPRDAQHD